MVKVSWFHSCQHTHVVQPDITRVPPGSDGVSLPMYRDSNHFMTCLVECITRPQAGSNPKFSVCQARTLGFHYAMKWHSAALKFP